jgi:hypothetical protein
LPWDGACENQLSQYDDATRVNDRFILTNIDWPVGVMPKPLARNHPRNPQKTKDRNDWRESADFLKQIPVNTKVVCIAGPMNTHQEHHQFDFAL